MIDQHKGEREGQVERQIEREIERKTTVGIDREREKKEVDIKQGKIDY